jgi:hypothetical protein
MTTKLRIEQCNYGGLGKQKNAASIKMTKLMERAANLDVIIATETHWSDQEAGIHKLGSTFYCYHRQREGEDQTRGGVAVFVRSNAKEITHTLHHKSAPNCKLETVTVKINLNSDTQTEQIYVTSVYAPPSKQTAEERPISDRELTAAMPDVPEEAKWIIGGDINEHHPMWDSRITETEGAEAFVTWLAQNGLQIWNDPEVETRTDPGRAIKSSPDITVSRNAQLLQWSSAKEQSDHHVITYATGENEVRTHAKRRFWSFKRARWEEFTSHTECAFRSKPSWEWKLTEWEHIILTAAKQFIPRTNHPDHKPLWTPAMQAAEETLVKMENLWQAAIREKKVTEELRAEREKIKEEYRSTMKEERSRELQKKMRLFEKGDPAAWRYIKNQGGNTQKNTGCVLSDGARELITDRQKAEAFIKKYAKTSQKHRDAHAPRRV